MKKRASVLIVFMAIRKMANWREKALRMRCNPGVEMSLRLHDHSRTMAIIALNISSRFTQGGMTFQPLVFISSFSGLEFFYVIEN